MRTARCTGRFYQVSKNIRHRGLYLNRLNPEQYYAIRCGGCCQSRGNFANSNHSQWANYGGSLGQSLLNSMLGADALRPQNPATSVTPTRTTQPTIGVLQPSTGTSSAAGSSHNLS
jgi:hypothetical protein